MEALLTKHFSYIEDTAKENNIKESGLKKVSIPNQIQITGLRA
jgi:hypothetical protein